MITFSVVKDKYGWAIRMGDAVSTPFRTRDLAIREAGCLADAIRCHGEVAEVIIEGANPNEPPRRIKGSKIARLDVLSPGRWIGPQ